MSKGEIIGVEWRSGIDSVCIVAVEYGHYWQAYIGASRDIIEVNPLTQVINGQMPEHHITTEHRTSIHGCKLSWQEAMAFFPGQDPKRYKTHPERPYYEPGD